MSVQKWFPPVSSQWRLFPGSVSFCCFCFIFLLFLPTREQTTSANDTFLPRAKVEKKVCKLASSTGSWVCPKGRKRAKYNLPGMNYSYTQKQEIESERNRRHPAAFFAFGEKVKGLEKCNTERLTDWLNLQRGQSSKRKERRKETMAVADRETQKQQREEIAWELEKVKVLIALGTQLALLMASGVKEKLESEV